MRYKCVGGLQSYGARHVIPAVQHIPGFLPGPAVDPVLRYPYFAVLVGEALHRGTGGAWRWQSRGATYRQTPGSNVGDVARHDGSGTTRYIHLSHGDGT